MILNDLTSQCKQLWKNFHSLRIHNNSIEFSLQTSGNNLSWFPYYHAPLKIEKLIQKWITLGGLNENP
jgi:hypothetical protein